MAKPVEKRGGARRPIRRRPTKDTNATPNDYYKDSKSTGIFPKRLGQHRLVICTDLETADMISLAMLTAWIKSNEKFFDSHNQFPIYGFVIGETHNTRIKAQRAREFLQLFATILNWDDPEHHHHKGFKSAGDRLWVDGESDQTFDNEITLLDNEDIQNDTEYPDPDPFIIGIDELLQSKASNLFMLYLKPLRFLQSLKDRPDAIEYMRKIPGSLYGGWNIQCIIEESPELKDIIHHFINRGKDEAPLLVSDSFHALGQDNIVSINTSPKLFREIDNAEEYELAYTINKTMYAVNDNILNQHILKLQQLPEFTSTDFDDYNCFKADREKLSTEHSEQFSYDIKIVDTMLQNNSRQFVFTDQLAIIAMLMASGTLKNTPFSLQRSTINIDDKYTTITANDASNTRVLVPKGSISKNHVGSARKLLEGMLLSAFKITE